MKLLCVERDRHGRLQVGGIYTAAGEVSCNCGSSSWLIEEFPSAHAGRPMIGQCMLCKREHIGLMAPYRGFLKRRFVPWNPEQLGITEEEVRQLNEPNKCPVVQAFEKQIRHAGFKIKTG